MQLAARGARVEDLAAIDEVRRIEETPDIKLCNDQDRIVLGCHNGKEIGQRPAKSAAFQRDGQVIAVADTGIDDAHPALGDGEACGRHTPAIAIPRWPRCGRSMALTFAAQPLGTAHLTQPRPSLTPHLGRDW